LPWSTPTLRSVRELVRGEITSALAGASFVGNSVLRVLADAQAGLAHLVLRYIDWLARQLLPDTAEKEWLDRHGTIWLKNADGSLGRKVATFAEGVVNFAGTQNTIVPSGTVLQATTDLAFETIEQIVIGVGPTECDVRALDPGVASNLAPGEALSTTVSGVDSVTVVSMLGGTDMELDEDLRARVLLRIQQPPMGGDAGDYTQWALSVAGVTRAWVSPNEMGVGTATVRFMEDIVRASTGGFPTVDDIAAVALYLNLVRPVTVKEIWVEAPIPEPINFTITNLDPDDTDVRARILASVNDMIYQKAAPARALNGVGVPAQTIYAAWVSQAIMEAEGVISFDLVMADHVMPNAGCLAILGVVTFA
jgi:uncharacterized phage protein gp47/JayE